MAKDFEAELDSIFSEREARHAKARDEAAQQSDATAAFEKAWDQLRTEIVLPTLDEMAAGLNKRGMPADIGNIDHGVCLYVHVNDGRLGGGRSSDGQPYLAISASTSTQRIHFERNTSGGGRGDGLGDLPIDQVNTDTVKTKVLTLIRQLFSER